MSKSLPYGWSLKSISSICSSKYGVVDGPFGSNLKSEHYRDSGVPVFQSGFVTSNRFVKKNYVYVDQEKYQEQIRSSAAPKDILMAKIGMNAGACAVIPDDHSVGILAGNSLKMTVNKDIASNLFLVNHLHFMQQNGEIRKLLTETAQPAISITTLKRHSVPLPPLPEQKKIAAILTSVDDVIEKTQAQIDKLKDLKTGMMQELLTCGVGVDGKPHTEFKDSPVGRIPNDWDVQSFSSVTVKIQDGTHFSPKSKDGECLYLTSKNIQKGKLLLTNISYISQEEHDEIYKRCDVKYGDVLLTKDGANTGNCAMNTLHEPFSLLSSVAFLRCDESICLNHYLYQYMSSSMFRKVVKDSMTGNAITRLTLTIIKSLKVPLPPIEEQEKIIKMLSGIDECMSVKQLKLESLKNTKKALMQDLLTGKKRVKVDG
ncbi:restriction endonuclease subunit S [Vibrio breoganii]|uniref:restriction endonuclease subunit S n=1 Tax=Vibrio breoganii TaxID=553239 RepID=UPI000C826307|nr:restriction endonuclease subunit S [Vibrio breoganii]PMK47720.1 hypothetical protein BCU00_05115 [Vibrio breoganii]TKG23309.1 restriction endonuclease subunit S [Vibrio breoganii]